MVDSKVEDRFWPPALQGSVRKYNRTGAFATKMVFLWICPELHLVGRLPPGTSRAEAARRPSRGQTRILPAPESTKEPKRAAERSDFQGCASVTGKAARNLQLAASPKARTQVLEVELHALMPRRSLLSSVREAMGGRA